MSNNYFKNLGNVWHTLSDNNIVLINDITKFANIVDKYRQDTKLHLNYTIKDDDRPELLSYKLYDTVDYWWTILLLNEMWDFDNQWPLPDILLPKFIREKYPLNNFNDIHHYETVDGYVTDLESLSFVSGVDVEDVPATFGLIAVTIEEHETEVNTQKRKIKLVDPDRMTRLISDFNEAMK
jgi:hypothetical protein